MPQSTPDIERDEFVPDPKVAEEFNISMMTLSRWTKDATLGFPPPVRIRSRNFRSRNQLEKFKGLLVRKAIARRTPEVV